MFIKYHLGNEISQEIKAVKKSKRKQRIRLNTAPILGLTALRQKRGCEASLGYTSRPCLKNR